MSETIFEKEIKIQQRISKAFEEFAENQTIAHDIGFHMTDWLGDIKDLLEVYSNIENLSDDEITGFVYKFLAHVPNHLNAAHKLTGLGKLDDVFNVGIFEDDDE